MELYQKYHWWIKKISIPTCTIECGRSITSNAMIANPMNYYFIVKIAAIVASFTPVNYDELIFFKHLIHKLKKKFNLPPISIDEPKISSKSQRTQHLGVIILPI